MPYKHKEDMAKYMREYRKRKKAEAIWLKERLAFLERILEMKKGYS